MLRPGNLRLVASDSELLHAWRAGDATAGDALVRRHFDAIYAFFRTKMDAEVDDLVQSTFAACVTASDQFREEAGFRTFLFAIARNQLRQFLRKTLGRRDLADVTSSMIDSGPSPSSFTNARGRRRTLLRALRTIPLDAQIALELFYWEGLSGVELAHVLGIPEGTARTRLRAARRTLRERIAQLAPHEESTASEDDLAQWVGSIREYLAHESVARR